MFLSIGSMPQHILNTNVHMSQVCQSPSHIPISQHTTLNVSHRGLLCQDLQHQLTCFSSSPHISQHYSFGVSHRSICIAILSIGPRVSHHPDTFLSITSWPVAPEARSNLPGTRYGLTERRMFVSFSCRMAFLSRGEREIRGKRDRN